MASPERQAEAAQELVERERAEREANIRKAALRPQRADYPDFDGVNCVDCEVPLPSIRIDLGRVRCVPCQVEAEKRGEGF